jgi:hypothetical protein
LALAVPVIAGLAVGILFIIIFAFSSGSIPNSAMSTIPNNLNLSIAGLKESYHAGEPITFTLRVTGYGDCYQTPNAAIWNASSAFASSPVWKSGTPAFTCDSGSQFVHFINDTYHWGEDRNVTVATTGNYVFGARIGVNPAIQEEFTVHTSDSAIGNVPSSVKCDQLSLCTYQLKAANTTYPINFRFNGTIESMALESPTETLTIKLKPEGSTYLQIAIPREVVDPRQGADGKTGAEVDFAVFLDEQNVDANELPKESEWTKTLGISDNPEQYRMLSIAIPEGTDTVEIVGTMLI